MIYRKTKEKVKVLKNLFGISETHLEVEEEDAADQIESEKFKRKTCKEFFFWQELIAWSSLWTALHRF